MKKILVIGRHKGMLEAVIGLLEDNDYDAFGTTDNAEAELLLEQRQPQAVVLGGGVDAESRNAFHKTFPERLPGVVVLDVHPSTLLAQLEEVL